MATSTRSSREERRKRIINRSSERLALITGRTQALPSPPPSPLPSPSIIDSLPSRQHLLDPIKSKSVGNDDDLNSKLLKKYELSLEPPTRNTSMSRVIFETSAREIQPAAGSQAMKTIFQDRSTGSETETSLKPPPRPHFFSSKRLYLSITESENARGCCAFIIAVLVVLSYVGYPLFGSHVVKSESIISSRPLYLLLLTDVTIVVARLCLNARRDSEEIAEEIRLAQEDNANWDGAVKLLERGLVVYQSIRGIFIDCSVYMVVVICCLSQM